MDRFVYVNFVPRYARAFWRSVISKKSLTPFIVNSTILTETELKVFPFFVRKHKTVDPKVAARKEGKFKLKIVLRLLQC